MVDQLTITRVIDRLYRRDSRCKVRLVLFDVLEQFGFCVGRAGDEDHTGTSKHALDFLGAENHGTGRKTLHFLLRILMAWTFLYAAFHQVFVPGWSVVGF